MLEQIAMFSLFALIYIYFGYRYVLRALQNDASSSKSSGAETFIKVTVLLTVRNEETEIRQRIDNILEQNYPIEMLDVLVASDGSTDSTNRIVSEMNNPRVRLFVSETGRGKTATQNAAIKFIAGAVVIFTDAGSRFEPDFVRKISSAFSDESVGAADGHLLFVARDSNQLAQSQGYYWRYELALREAESRLGILAIASGACLAVRRELFVEMDPSIGEDCIVPLDIVTQGRKVVHVSNAIAYDVMENDPDREFKSRVRMTLRNWQGTWSRPQLLNLFASPGYAFALWSHKLLRWLSPFFLITLTVCAFIGALLGMMSMQVVSGFLLVFYFGALVGWFAEKLKWRVPFVAMAYSFMLANAGFLVGVSMALLGRKIYKYR